MITDYVSYIHTEKAITFITDDIPTQVTSDHPNFKTILDILTNSHPKDTDALLDLAKPVEVAKRAVINSSIFSFDNNNLECVVDGYNLNIPQDLANEVLRVHNSEGCITPLENFVYNLAQNPDREVIDQLFGFIKACNLTVTEHGNFLAYKVVDSDFKDIYTRTIDNSPGAVVSMPRFAVEKNPEKTCSAGLHFAAWEYLDSYANTEQSKVLLLEINPAHVVSIPSDYNNMKGRTQQYTVLREVVTDKELENLPVFKSTDMDWIKWSKKAAKNAGLFEIPENIDPDTLVEVKLKNKEVLKDLAYNFVWSKPEVSPDQRIVAYRVIH